MSLTILKIATLSSLVLVLAGCAPKVPTPPAPASLVLPKPKMNNQGKYMFPYTQDGVLTKWTDKVIAAEGASQVGGSVGAYAGAKALEQVPFVGGFLGQMAGEEIGKGIVLNAAGGMDKIKETSNVSFDHPKDYCVYAYAKYSGHKYYGSAMKAAGQLYREVNEQTCMQYIHMAGAESSQGIVKLTDKMTSEQENLKPSTEQKPKESKTKSKKTKKKSIVEQNKTIK